MVDTNVLSEFAKSLPNTNVQLWFDKADPDTLFASIVTFGGIRLGVENMAVGKRRAVLEAWLENGLPAWFTLNLLSVTKRIADRWGRVTIQARRKGLQLTTALEHDLILITRNVKDFGGLGVKILNPWAQ